VGKKILTVGGIPLFRGNGKGCEKSMLIKKEGEWRRPPPLCPWKGSVLSSPIGRKR